MSVSPLSIGIDCRFASEYAGLGTYTRELVSALLTREDGLSYTLFVRHESEKWLQALPRKPMSIVRAPFPHYSLAEQLRFPSLIKGAHLKLFFSPQFNVPLWCPAPFVCTVHDLILHKYPNDASTLKRMAYRYIMRSSVKRARSVITISEATKHDLELNYGAVVFNKTQVIPPGIHPRFRRVAADVAASVAGRYGLSGRFILYVGNAKQHKNVQTLIDAFNGLALPDCTLAMIISGPERARLRFGANARLLFGVSDADLPALYSAAAGFATASLYEGFGLPAVEAMACGCPVLVSNTDALIEATGGHAIVAEPTVDGIAEGLKKLLTEKPNPEALTWARGFSWEKAAEEMSKVFKKNSKH